VRPQIVTQKTSKLNGHNPFCHFWPLASSRVADAWRKEKERDFFYR
jgi:hypothetical protein